MSTTDTNSPTPPQGEIEQLKDVLMHTHVWTYSKGERVSVQLGTLISFGDNWKVVMSLITAQVQAAEDRGCREALKHLQTLLDDPWYHHDTERLQALRNEMAALGDSHE